MRATEKKKTKPTKKGDQPKKVKAHSKTLKSQHNTVKPKSKMVKPQSKIVSYDLFHSCGEVFWELLRYRDEQEVVQALEAGKYHWMHTFELDVCSVDQGLDQVFELGQNFDEPWNPRFECRSTCVGDVIRVNGEFWVIASQGFTKLNVDPTLVVQSEPEETMCSACAEEPDKMAKRIAKSIVKEVFESYRMTEESIN